jgi:hypothetical protein
MESKAKDTVRIIAQTILAAHDPAHIRRASYTAFVEHGMNEIVSAPQA